MEKKFKFVPVYQVSFRRMGIEKYLATGCQKKHLLAKHGIAGKRIGSLITNIA